MIIGPNPSDFGKVHFPCNEICLYKESRQNKIEESGRQKKELYEYAIFY